MPYSVPGREELLSRIGRLHRRLCERLSDWDTAIVVNQINLYYLTGSKQDAVFLLRRNGDYFIFGRRSYERVRMECPLDNMLPMRSYREIAEAAGDDCGVCVMETETVPVALLERMKKYLSFKAVLPLEREITALRAVKSPWELSIIEESGRQHAVLLNEIAPSLLREGMSECELIGEMYSRMLQLGYHGVSRFNMFQMELIAGQFGFGESSLYPTSFDGPGGMLGMSPAVPIIGSRDRLLKKGDLVFIDVGYGVDGYHTDKTQIYCYKGNPSPEAIEAHRRCMGICGKTASLLRPGTIPSEIYAKAVSPLEPAFMENFMGFGSRRAAFIGHGVGLQVDESPVVAPGFDEPLEENMIVALEPKKGIAGQGLVGVEETYAVTQDGGRCLTGGCKEIISV